ncbi:MAG: hypothetical protein ABFQ64_07915 [Campylobacterota bacterium]
MELKDVILSTLAEMEDDVPTQAPKKESVIEKESVSSSGSEISNEQAFGSSDSELMYLNSIRERLLVLFEGFQAPNNTNIEAKVDMTLNFLEYVLATIDSRVQMLEKGDR